MPGPLNVPHRAVHLTHDEIARRIPHAGRMALLDELLDWGDDHVVCRSVSHRSIDHPLRTAHGLLGPIAIEYAAQAMALHGALLAERDDPNAAPKPGFLASVRQVQCHAANLAQCQGALDIEATRQAGQGDHILYAFRVSHAGQCLVEGRATVVLNTPMQTLA